MNHDIITIHLPDGESFELKLDFGKNDNSKQDINEELEKFKNLLSEAEHAELRVKPNINSLMKERRLILWGNTLKNSYITVNRY